MLTATGQMDRIIGYAGSRGCAVRGTYGEGSQAVGGFYQVSNQVTLGASAAELTDKLVETATTIIDAEKKAREQVRSQNEPALRDRIYRAAGTMKSAYLIDTSEAVQCISDVLIGLQMGFLSGMDAQKLYTLEEHIRPAMLTGAPQDLHPVCRLAGPPSREGWLISNPIYSERSVNLCSIRIVLPSVPVRH